MKSNYKPLGNYIKQIKKKNTDGSVSVLKGIRINKEFMESVANIQGTDLSRYRVVEKYQFAYNPMHVGRDEILPISLLLEEEPIIVSPAYVVFEILDHNELDPEYLMMWCRRSEFDRNVWFTTDSSVRGGFSWESLCDLELPIPSIEKQREIVAEYNTIVNRIKLNETLNQKLEETAQALYKHWFVDESEKEWKTYRLSDLLEISGGYSYKSEKMGLGTTYLLGMGCVSFIDRFLEKGMRLYSDDVPEKHLIGPGDIVIATRQQTDNYPILGAPSIIPKSFKNYRLLVASNLYRVNNKSIFSNNFIFQLLRSNEYKEHIKLNAKGTTVGMITKSDIEDFTFKLPEEKNVLEFENKLNVIVDRIEQCTLEVKMLKTFQNLVLSKMSKTA
ncbi:restriction endonuclease subunit S [Winogradskyella litoriviva]|uniref:Restriction endonuclease subunit S n=1 Tax=Winogradskyella litoriviva TaxID=1220182 RepID=A0ABX2E6X2_9FLAO|nr:restriction endonuclease subunit S [Winogradskyella litoriviva]NRD24099.1 restriction endonuclease subunit S [Winogradskyella litoriviva]